ncbi:MAG: 30S ribosomal protein S17 [SAR202 cluster bacterium]|nr:30S ribosomal protein S17 [SAR202 cluster bacterium]|tara:strand:- start:1959 stop:2345 length:387 start_codon:yes stop_codon:yes gene_type:complete
MGNRKVEVGRVVSNIMDKTVVVTVQRRSVHRIYKKAILRQKRFKVHDENNTCQIGDVVEIEETRPLSKSKRWRVAKVLIGGYGAETAPTTAEEVQDISSSLENAVEETTEEDQTTETENASTEEEVSA